MGIGTKIKMESIDRELRVRQPFRYPVDPLQIVTMSDYDLTLVLARTWFNFGNQSDISPELIESWHFDQADGSYEFFIDRQAKWSNGQSVTPHDLKMNLDRAIKSGSTYGVGIGEIIDIDTFKISGEKSFGIHTTTHEPSAQFLQRMCSAFLSVASPSSFTPRSHELSDNLVSLGSYVVSRSSDEELELRPNPYSASGNALLPRKIRVKKPDPNFDVMAFLKEETWENYVQLTTILPPEAEETLISSGLPYWTRSHDRVSLLKPAGEGHQLLERRQLLKALAAEFQALDILETKMNVRKTESLQPRGYPLHERITFSQGSNPAPRNKTIRVLAPATLVGDFHKSHIEMTAAKLSMNVDWIAEDLKTYYETCATTNDFDFVLISFGVADPEPTTWMALLFSQSNFISYDEADKQAFKKISATDDSETATRYRNLLKDIALRGGFLPLFHFSTLSIGSKNMSFEAINSFDETVNFAKVIMR